MIVIETHSGLCNILRMVFSFYYLSLEKKEKLYVIWKPDSYCPGFFLDYFEPIENVEFMKENKKKYIITHRGDWYEKYSPYRMFVYDKLKPRKEIQKIIDKVKKKLKNNYIAVHIRRTDHKAPKHRYTSDEDFINFIEKHKDKNLYIATDNCKTQKKFYNNYKSNIKILNRIKPSGKLRQTTLKTSIIELYICIYAYEFKGSGWSSYSSTISQFRNHIIS